jgi:hypothetical protein
MRNILSFQQPLPGKEIKEWISFHSANETEYTPIANQMKRFGNLSDKVLYRIDMHPRKSWHGKERKYKPNVVRVDGKKTDL